MLIIWGSYDSPKEWGVVAERCPHCGRATSMRVVQHYKVPHFYFIPLGSGSLVATVLTCSECTGQINGSLPAYRRIVPREASLAMTLEQILEQTNPRLNEELAYRTQLEQDARDVRHRAAGLPDPRLELAFARLAEVRSPPPEVHRLQGRLSQWGSLDPATQAELLRDIDGVVEELEQQKAALRFVGLMGQQFKPEVDAGLGILSFLVVAGLGITAAVLALGDAFLCVGILASLVLAGIAAAFVQRRLRRRSHRRFFRTIFLPEAHRHGVGIVRALALLQETQWDAGIDPTIRALAAQIPLLHEILKEASTDGNVVEGAAVLARSYPARPSPKPALNLSAVSRGVSDIDAVRKVQQEYDVAFRFLRVISQRFPSQIDGGFAILVFFLAGALLITAASMVLSEVALFFAILASIFAAAAVAALANRQLRRFLHRRFFRKTFLPAAHYQKVNVARALAILQESGPLQTAAEREMRSMAAALPLLHQIFKEASPDGDMKEALAQLARSYPATPQPPRSLKWVGVVALVGLGLACAGGFSWLISEQNQKREAEEKARAAFFAPFLARLPEFTPAAPERDIQPPYRRGKVMPINVAGTKGIDTLFLALPDPLKPGGPDEVGTIVWLQWGKETVGTYTDNVDAVVITCNVTIIDKAKGVIIAERTFTGGPPPQERRKLNDPNHGSSPGGDIIGWLMSLPVQQ